MSPAQVHFARTQLLVQAPRELVANLRAVEAFVGQAERFWANVKVYLPGVQAELQRRKKLAAAERRVFHRQLKVNTIVDDAFADRFGDRQGRKQVLASTRRLETRGSA